MQLNGNYLILFNLLFSSVSTKKFPIDVSSFDKCNINIISDGQSEQLESFLNSNDDLNPRIISTYSHQQKIYSPRYNDVPLIKNEICDLNLIFDPATPNQIRISMDDFRGNREFSQYIIIHSDDFHPSNKNLRDDIISAANNFNAKTLHAFIYSKQEPEYLMKSKYSHDLIAKEWNEISNPTKWNAAWKMKFTVQKNVQFHVKVYPSTKRRIEPTGCATKQIFPRDVK